MKRTLKTILLLAAILVSCSDDANDVSEEANAILATWRIMEVTISEATLVQRTPDEEFVTITFEDTGELNGNTSVNTFSGSFNLEGPTLNMTSFSTTEVADTVFAGAFYGAISEALLPGSTVAQFGTSFEGNTLILVFGNNGEMVLEKQ